MICIYRISDSSQTSAHKPKIPEATKLACLRNFIATTNTSDSLYILADNVSETTFKNISMYINNEYIVRTNYGSGAITFLHGAIMAKDSTLPEDTPIYFVEDDYIHAPESLKILREGLALPNVDYVTLYDHPDKYLSPPHRLTQVFVTNSCHWRTTPSTTMTFATTVKVVKEDYRIYEEFCKTGYPHDHEMFCALASRKGRTLISSIPGYSTHAEIAWLSPIVPWKNIIENYTDT